MRIDAHGKTTDELIRLAVAVSLQKTQIIIVNANSMATDQLVRIAGAGHGCVHFDFIE